MLRIFTGKTHLNHAAALRLFGPISFQRAESSGNSPAAFEEEKNRLREELTRELPGPYNGPERDLVNFPRRKNPVEPGKVRMAFIPDEWFQFFYKKTGVTGPYLFGTGLLTYLLSKEWYVIEEELSTGISIFILAYIAVKKFGPATRAFAEKCQKEELAQFDKAKGDIVVKLDEALAEEKKNNLYFEGSKIVMQAKRENIQMQLEAEYRRRIMNVYEQTKRRLDYNLELYNTKRKLEQKHMVDWIVNSVVKSITPDQEKEALKKCIEDLNVLAVKA